MFTTVHVIAAGMSDLEHRKLFSRQPGIIPCCIMEDSNIVTTARVVLVDFRPPMDGGTCLNMLQALTDTLMLAHHLTGPSRIPLFSLIALGLYPEVMLYAHSNYVVHVIHVAAGVVSITASQW